jgi:hypothetical protein
MNRQTDAYEALHTQGGPDIDEADASADILS